MYAIVDIAGQQFKVTEDQEIFTHRLDAEPGESIEFGSVLLTDRDGEVEIGTPLLSTKVTAQVLEHVKGDKVIVFKKKRRKGYRKKNGHRQAMTKLKIETIA